MTGISSKAITHRQFLKMCGLAIVGAGATQMVVPPKPVSADTSLFENVQASGWIGIGTAASGARLHIQAAAADNTVLKIVHPDGWNAFTVGKTGGMMTQSTLQMYGNDDIILDSGTNMLIHNGGNKIGIQTSGNGNAILYDRMLIPSGSDTANIAFLNSNVGIGTTTPQSKLDLGTGGGTAKVRLYEDGGSDNKAGFGIDMSGASYEHSIYFRTNANGHLAVGTWNGTAFSEKVRVASSGNVGIGTTTPGAALDVNGTVNLGTAGYNTSTYNLANANWLTVHGAPSAGYLNVRGAATGTVAYFDNGTSEVCRINSSGNVGIGQSNPSQQLDVVGTVRATTQLQLWGNGQLQVQWRNSDGGVDQKFSEIIEQNGMITFRTVNDAYTQAADWLKVFRNSGSFTINKVQLPAGELWVGGIVSIKSDGVAAQAYYAQ